MRHKYLFLIWLSFVGFCNLGYACDLRFDTRFTIVALQNEKCVQVAQYSNYFNLHPLTRRVFIKQTGISSSFDCSDELAAILTHTGKLADGIYKVDSYYTVSTAFEIIRKSYHQYTKGDDDGYRYLTDFNLFDILKFNSKLLHDTQLGLPLEHLDKVSKFTTPYTSANYSQLIRNKDKEYSNIYAINTLHFVAFSIFSWLFFWYHPHAPISIVTKGRGEVFIFLVLLVSLPLEVWLCLNLWIYSFENYMIHGHSYALVVWIVNLVIVRMALVDICIFVGLMFSSEYKYFDQ